MKSLWKTILDGLTYQDLAGKRQLRAYAVITLAILILLGLSSSLIAKTAKSAAPEALPWAPKATPAASGSDGSAPAAAAATNDAQAKPAAVKKVKTAAAKKKTPTPKAEVAPPIPAASDGTQDAPSSARHRRRSRIHNSEFGTFQIGYVCHGGIAEGRDLACLGLPKTSCHCVYAASAASIADVLARAVGAATA